MADDGKRKYLTKFIGETNKSFVEYANKEVFEKDEVGFIKNNAQLQLSFFVGAFVQIILKSAYGKYESLTLQRWLSWQVFNKLNLLKIYTRTAQEMRRLELGHHLVKELKNEIERLILKKSNSVSNAKVEFCIYWGMDEYENFLCILDGSKEYEEYAKKQEENKQNQQGVTK